MTIREERLHAELEVMQGLKAESTILEFSVVSDPPDHYTVKFRGRGINRGTSNEAKVDVIEFHKCEIRLPFSFPRRPPDVRWRSPICHPNISFSGLVKLREVGLPWHEDLGLDIVCVRLWDVARLAYINDEKACNDAAKNWLRKQITIKMPVDDRPLRDKLAPSRSNVIRYEWRSDDQMVFPLKPSGGDDVFYIDDETPTPELPKPQPRYTRLPSADDEDVFFIGDE